MSQKLLVISDFNYADEFDVRGWAIKDQAKWQAHLAEVKAYFDHGDELENYFGTNESIIWSSYDDYANGFTMRPITDDEADTIRRLFGRNSDASGTFIQYQGDFNVGD